MLWDYETMKETTKEGVCLNRAVRYFVQLLCFSPGFSNTSCELSKRSVLVPYCMMRVEVSNRTKKYCTFTYDVATGLKHRSFEVSQVWSSSGTFSHTKSRRMPSIFGDSFVCPSPEVRWLSLNFYCFYLRRDETWMKVLTMVEPPRR